MITIPAALVLVVYILISQYIYRINLYVEGGYTICFRCNKCGQVHTRREDVCVACGQLHEHPNRMSQEVGKWKFTRRPTKILFYTVDKEWEPKEEE